MIVGIAILSLLAVVVLVGAAVGMRRWGLDDSRTEARLLSPATHTVSYLVPDGEDPTVVMAALRTAGFTCIVSEGAHQERVVVECEPADREVARNLIDHARRSALSGTSVDVGHVAFEDEG